MKKVALVLCLAFVLSGCFMNKALQPSGKTDADWEREEMECRTSSGKIVGFWGVMWPGAAHNWGEVNDKYNACMREKGWYK